jgi:hypothetical protein
VHRLTGTYVDLNGGETQTRTLHAVIPADVILREAPRLDPTLRHLNEFAASADE